MVIRQRCLYDLPAGILVVLFLASVGFGQSTFGSLTGEFTSFTVEGGGTVKYTNNSVVVTFQ